MWMLLRRRRSALLLLGSVLVTVGYLTYTADELVLDGGEDISERLLQPEAEAVQQMLIDTQLSENDRYEMQTSTGTVSDTANSHDSENKNKPETAAETDSRPEVKQMKDKGQRKGSAERGRRSRERQLAWKERRNSRVKKDRGQAGQNRVHLLLLAYMRTGSSMTGHILQYSPDVFYWYEPLHELERYYVTGGNISSHYRNSTLNDWFRSSHMAGGNISAALACDMAHVYHHTLLYNFMAYGTFGTRRVHRCFASAYTRPQWDRCIRNSSRSCRQHYRATAVKTIRLHMSRALEVMQRDPKVKVVHLVRDPRAVLLSRHKLGYANFRKLSQEAEVLCRKYEQDLELIPAYGDPFRDRYTLIRFEDLAEDPLTYTRQLYNLMEIEASQTILRAIRAMTAFVKKSRACPTCPLLPRNSSYVAQDWRLSMSFSDVSTISKQCGSVMRLLGYRADFRDEEELRDLNIPAVRAVTLV